MDNIILDGGLDLVRARPATDPGRLQDCFNYEVGWHRGYARIDGFERYDGSISPSSTTGWVLEVDKSAFIGGQFFTPVEDLTWTDGVTVGSSGILVDQEEVGDKWRLFIIFRTGRVRPVFGTVITGVKSGASFELTEATTGGVTTFPEYYTTQLDYQNALAEFAEILRGEVLPVPGTGTIVGLHFHEDALYAIRDALTVTVQSTAVTFERGMYVYNDSGQIAEVVSVKDNNQISLSAVDEDGFNVGAGTTLHVALSIRFNTGGGVFFKFDPVTGSAGLKAQLGYTSLRDGAWESDNALGVAVFINQTVAGVSVGSVISVDDVTRYGEMTVEAVQHTHRLNAAIVAEVANSSAEASLWKSTDEGWVPAPVGGVVNFNTGTTEILATDYTAGEDTQAPGDTDVVGTGPTERSWTDRNNIKVSDDNYATVDFNNTNVNEVGTVQLRVDTFGFQLSDNDEITGFEVYFEGFENDPASQNHFSVWLDEATNNKRKFETDDQGQPDGEVTRIAGADQTDWSSVYTDNPPPSVVRSSAFGFVFELRVDTGQSTIFSLDAVSAKVFYQTPVGDVLYLWNGSSDVGYIRRSSVPVLSDGNWDGTGEGTIQVTDWTPYELQPGWEIRTEQGGLGDLIGVVAAEGVTVPTLPGSLLLNENKSRYQMISYNFYASEDRNAIYGCSGAGPAFVYDGEVLQFIYTGLPREDDQPRHVAPHEFRLALGYQWGEVYTSVPGQPLEWDGTLFATTFGFGDKITGLMPVAGGALAVFTESSVWTLTGAAGDEQNPADQNIINHKIGAIEYTVQSIGNRPVFASFRGIETLETMDEYSDFMTAPMTYDISPWLLERLQTAAGIEATDKSVVNSVVVRNKNQYRLFFADGYLATLTLVGTEREPQNTVQKYWFNNDQREYARVFATASGTTSDGRDRAFFSVEERPETPEQVGVSVVSPGEVDYVFELDRGRSFDGGIIEAEFSVTHNFGMDQEGQSSPMATSRYNVFHIHGVAHAYAALRISRSANYEFLDSPNVLPYELYTMGGLDKAPEATLNPKYTKGRLTARGFALTFHVKHESNVEFPHVIQMITLLDDQAMKLNR